MIPPDLSWPPPAEEPVKGPTITGNENRSAYRVGDLLLLNCSSTYSYPPTTLTWDIDGHKVSKVTLAGGQKR